MPHAFVNGKTTNYTAGAPALVAPVPMACKAALVTAMNLIETTPGEFSLLLDAGATDVDEVIEELGHEPNGYFWEGVAQFLVSTQAPSIEERIRYDSEAGMFCAYGKDRSALEELAALMTAVAVDGYRTRQVIESAEASGFEFDD